MLAVPSLVPVVLVLAWLVAEFRGKTFPRVTLGIAALCSVAVMAFLWGAFVEGFKHTEFPVPHDSPAETTVMDAADEPTTNNVSK
jgi:hypothetical protein